MRKSNVSLLKLLKLVSRKQFVKSGGGPLVNVMLIVEEEV